eukprot:220683-Hanusia_phi.AAC.1
MSGRSFLNAFMKRLSDIFSFTCDRVRGGKGRGEEIGASYEERKDEIREDGEGKRTKRKGGGGNGQEGKGGEDGRRETGGKRRREGQQEGMYRIDVGNAEHIADKRTSG